MTKSQSNQVKGAFPFSSNNSNNNSNNNNNDSNSSKNNEFLLFSPTEKENETKKTRQEKQKEHDTCNDYVTSGLNRNVTVKFLMEKLINMGCTPPKGFINCIDCGTKYAGGGFGVVEEETTLAANMLPSNSSLGDGNSGSSKKTIKKRHECNDTFIFKTLPKRIEKQNQDKNDNNKNQTKLRLLPEIFLCQQHLVSEDHAHQSLVHELIHAIDLCRTKMDPINNCIHMSCTEIRAENLSGECTMMREMVNGRISNFKGHGAECVKRRALLSVKANPNCQNRAEEYVDAAFDRCFKDTFPFDRHPSLR